MARSCGIRIGPRRFELVVIDGNAKRHKIVAYKAGEFDPTDGDSYAQAVSALKEAAKTHKIPRDNVGLVVDARHAAFRRLSLPFSDRAKIEQVIKYEVEGDLPQWNIDDVIVDFHVVAENENSCEVITSAIPKEHLSDVLEMCEKAGIEILEAELETSAIVNAALAADICHIDDAQLLVHIGDYSTSVVVMDAGDVREMRVIHIGALTHEIVRPKSEVVDGVGDGVVEGEPVPVDSIEASRRIDQAVKRIRRELGRSMSGARTINPIDSIYVCGIELPGLIGDSVLDVPVYLLDCFEEDSGQPAEGYGVLVAAYGAAVRQVGGGKLRPSLRREELRYTGTWERIEFPLAVACLLLCTCMLVINMLQHRERHYLEHNGVLYWLKSSNNYMVGELEAGTRGNLSPVPEDIKAFRKKFMKADLDLAENPPLEAMRSLKLNLQGKIAGQMNLLGHDKAVRQPQSAFVAMNLVLGVLQKGAGQWRPSLRKVHSTFQQGKSGKPDTCKVTLDVTFFSEEENGPLGATRDYEKFRAAIKDQDWCVEMGLKGTEPLEDGNGIFTQGVPITVDVAKYYDKKRRAIAEGL